MLELYHNDMSVCAQKVRHLLHEKGLEWTSHHMSLRHKEHTDPAYLALNPNGVVPTLVHDGASVVESTIITEYLEDCFCETSFRPADPVLRARMRHWTKQLDDSIHAATAVATISIGIRKQYAEVHGTQEEIDEVLDAVPNPKWRALKRQLIERGMAHPGLPDALIRLDRMLEDMQQALSRGQWLVGDTMSLADIGFYPYVLRLDHLALGTLIQNRPALAEWYRRMSARSATRLAYEGEWLNAKYVADLTCNGTEARPVVLGWIRETGMADAAGARA